MKNVPVAVKEYVFCDKENELIPLDECTECAYHAKRQRIGFNTFVQCIYVKKEVR